MSGESLSDTIADTFFWATQFALLLAALALAGWSIVEDRAERERRCTAACEAQDMRFIALADEEPACVCAGLEGLRELSAEGGR